MRKNELVDKNVAIIMIVVFVAGLFVGYEYGQSRSSCEFDSLHEFVMNYPNSTESLHPLIKTYISPDVTINDLTNNYRFWLPWSEYSMKALLKELC